MTEAKFEKNVPKDIDETLNETEPENAVPFACASQWELIHRRFRRHRLARISLGVLAAFYIIVLFAGFLSPYDPLAYNSSLQAAPPMRIRIWDADRGLQRPFVYGLRGTLDMRTLRRVYEVDTSKRIPIFLIVRGDYYNFLGLLRTNLHLFGNEGEKVHLLGTDRLGRDMLSRIFYGARISLTIGLVGVTLSLILGLVMGGISGLLGGFVDTMIQRLIEILRSFPTIPLWMALAAALPTHWPQLWVYFGITAILSLVGWTSLARVVRGKFLSLRDEDYVTAAKLAGAGTGWIIRRHLIPSFASHIIASVTLALPSMIIAETSLSFLGLGLKQPIISWGVLLQEAQNIRSVATMPWVLSPVLFVILSILAFNFVGDGLRDAADPYS